MKDRPTGYYWIKFRGEKDYRPAWYIADYDYWYICGEGAFLPAYEVVRICAVRDMQRPVQ